MKYNQKQSMILLLAVLFLSAGCSVSKISIKNDELGKLRSVIILPFEKIPEVPDSVKTECENNFKNYFIKVGLRIADEKETSAVTDIIDDTIPLNAQISKIRSHTGADAVVTGRITRYKEEVKTSARKRGKGHALIPGFGLPGKGYHNDMDIFEIKTFYFNINLQLISLKTGAPVLTIENRFSSSTDESNAFKSLDEFKNHIIKEMGNDIMKALAESEVR